MRRARIAQGVLAHRNPVTKTCCSQLLAHRDRIQPNRHCSAGRPACINLAQTIIHRCSVKLKLMLMFAETGDMRKHGPKERASRQCLIF